MFEIERVAAVPIVNLILLAVDRESDDAAALDVRFLQTEDNLCVPKTLSVDDETESPKLAE